jgi:hypothetical protein
MHQQGVDCTRNFTRFSKEFRINGVDPSKMPHARALAVNNETNNEENSLLPEPQNQKLEMLEKAIL